MSINYCFLRLVILFFTVWLTPAISACAQEDGIRIRNAELSETTKFGFVGGRLLDAFAGVALLEVAGDSQVPDSIKLVSTSSGSVLVDYVFQDRLIGISRSAKNLTKLTYGFLLRDSKGRLIIEILNVSEKQIELKKRFELIDGTGFKRPQISVHSASGDALSPESNFQSNVFLITEFNDQLTAERAVVADENGAKASFALPGDIEYVTDVALPNTILGINSRSGYASLVDLDNGSEISSKYLPNLTTKKPNSLLVLTPNVGDKQASGVVVFNLETSVLSFVPTNNEGTVKRISEPVNISLKDALLLRKGSELPLLIADQDLSIIAVSSSQAARIIIMRRLNRGIEVLGERRLSIKAKSAAMNYVDKQGLSQGFAYYNPTDGQFEVFSAVEKNLQTISKNADFDIDNDVAISEKKETKFKFTPKDFETIPNIETVLNLQRVLATLGFTVGGIDGELGNLTTNAVKNFQLDQSIPTSGIVDEKTVEALNSEVQKIGLDDPKKAEYIEDFRKYIQRRVPGTDVSVLLALGKSHSNPESRCFGLNELPPKKLWSNSVAFAKILQRLRKDYGLDVNVVSGYRSSAYGRCAARGDEDGSHANFRGFDIRLEDGATNNTRLESALKELREKGVFSGEIIGSQRYSIHVDTIESKKSE